MALVDELKKAANKAAEKVTPAASVGMVRGSGTGTSDSNIIAASNGEYMLPKATTDAIGKRNLDNIVRKTSGQEPGGRPVEGFINGIGQYWSNDNAEFERGNPSIASRIGRAINPLTSFGSALGAMHDAAGNGDKIGMGLAAAQAIPAFGAIRTISSPAFGAIKAAAARSAPDLAKTGASVLGNAAFGAAADTYSPNNEKQIMGYASGGQINDISGDVRMRAMQQRPLSQIAAENVWRDTAANTPKPGAAPAPQAAPTTTSAPKVSGASRLATGLGGLAAGAGIGGAVQSIADNSTGYRDEFENRTGVRGLAGDALRTLGAVGDAATFGLATKFGQGLASATNGGSFVQGINEPTMREQFAERTGAKPAASPAVSDAYPDEGQRGAAKTALSQLANSSVAGGQNFADWQKGATQMQRDTAADAYREAWQERTPQGMSGADANATALYNAEQATRGTGVTAQRGKNGTMEFSGDGANALPQSFTQGVDLNLANERNARANAIRQQMIDSQPGTRASIGNSAVEETNARFQASRDRDAMQNMGRSQLGALAQMRNTDMQRERMNAEMALRGQELEGTNAYRQGSLAQQAAQTDVQRQRLGIDQQEAGTRALTAGINDRKSQAEMAEMQRIGKLRDAYMAEPEGSPKREQIGRALLMLQGKEPSQPRDEETKARYGLITELAKGYGAMPPTGPDGKPIPFDQYAGPVLQMASGNRGGNGQQQQFPDAAIQALRANPKLAADFDAKYGQGASRQFIQ